MDAPPDGLDSEDVRRWKNKRRRLVRRQNRRRRWLEAIRTIDPAVAEELEKLRRVSPMAFRKRLVFLAKKHDLFDYVHRWSPRDLPSLAERRAADESDAG